MYQSKNLHSDSDFQSRWSSGNIFICPLPSRHIALADKTEGKQKDWYLNWQELEMNSNDEQVWDHQTDMF